MRLNEFQDEFKALMLDEPEALETPSEALAGFLKSGDIALKERLNVYRANVVGSLSDMIMATFPLLNTLVGEDFLRSLARSFVMARPPSQGCLNHYGAGMAEFIESSGAAKDIAYLPDVARLELAINQAYYAENDTPLRADELGAIAPEELGALQIFPRDSVRLIRSNYPLTAIKDYCLGGGEGDAPDMNSGGGAIMVYRPQTHVDIVPLDKAEYEMLSALLEGQPLGAAFAQALQTDEAFDLQGFLEKHFTLETFLPLGTNS